MNVINLNARDFRILFFCIRLIYSYNRTDNATIVADIRTLYITILLNRIVYLKLGMGEKHIIELQNNVLPIVSSKETIPNVLTVYS